MLAASSVGAVLGAQYSGRLVHRLGSKNTIRISQFVMPLGVITMGLTMTVPGIMAGLFDMENFPDSQSQVRPQLNFLNSLPL